jgi:hypothetical protein
MKKICNYLLLFYCLLCCQVFAQSLQFWGEKIEVTIYNHHADVWGEYHFKNNSSNTVHQTLYYPFVVNPHLPYPDSIAVTSHSQRSPIPIRKSNNGIYFPVSIAPHQPAIYKVFYSQATTASQMEYVLTTTQGWHKPLVWTEYQVKIPLFLRLKYLSLTNPEIELTDKYKIYRVHKINYMPNVNLKVAWAGREK